MLPVEISVNPLDSEIRKNIVEKVLGEYNKKLDSEQVSQLFSSKKRKEGKPFVQLLSLSLKLINYN